jgi:hypothetical protein
MHHFFLVPTTALAAVVALGCGDPQSATVPSADPATPSLSVERTSGPFFAFAFGNEEYTVLVASTLENWQIFCATGEENWDTWEELIVTRPDGSEKHTLTGEDIHVLVWPAGVDLCEQSPDFSGTGDILAHDNDFNLDGPGGEATGHRLVGRVTDENGQLYHLTVAFLFTVSREFTSVEEPFDLISRAQKILLRPIGR